MNYYPFHIGDYASATRHLSWDEDAAYRRLLDVYYTTEKPIPTDLRAVYRLVMAQTDSQRESVQTVLAEFFEQTADGWVNKRADAEIEAMRRLKGRQANAARSRWNKVRNAPAMPRHEETDATASKTDADAMPPTPTPTERERKPRKAAATRLTEVILPHEWANYCRQNRPDLDPALVFTLFRNYWTAKKGGDAEKLDWYATWQNWVIREKPTPNVAAKKSGVLAL